MRESEALEFLKQGNADGKKLEELVAQEKLVRIIHQGQPFYVRKLPMVKSED